MKISGLDLNDLATPISEAEPCGPDLDRLDDPDYLNFMASVDGVLPASYFDFDRANFDFDTQFAGVAGFLAKSRDLRLLTVLAKLVLLKRDLAAFAACIDAIATLLRERWDSVHPQVDGGSVEARLAPVRALNDFPLIALALQYLPILQTRRSGTISYRRHLVATGQANLREGEEALDLAAIERELEEADLDLLKETNKQLHTVKGALESIRLVSLEHAGGDAVDLAIVEPLVGAMIGMLEATIARRDPDAVAQPADGSENAADGDAPARAEAPARRVGSTEEAVAALAGVAGYFSRVEPSSPVLLLTRQAQALMGKSFFEVMQVLAPERVGSAAFHIGGPFGAEQQAIVLPLQNLAPFAEVGADAGAPTPDHESVDYGGEVAEPSADAGSGEAIDAAPEASGDAPGEAAAPTPPPPSFAAISSRREAMAVLDAVGVFFRTREPSSPIPLLIERAKALAERDFLYLLQQISPS